MKRQMSTALALFVWPMLCQVHAVKAENLPPPVITGNSVEICLNSRYSQHNLNKSAATPQQMSNILWAAGKAPVTGAYRRIYIVTPAGTKLYNPVDHSLTSQSSETPTEGAFAIRYESELDFDTGASFMPALLASVSLSKSTESAVASCPKGLGYPQTRLIFGVQATKGLTPTLAVHSSIPQGQPGWLPDPCTVGADKLEEVLGNLKYVSSFGQTSLTPQQVSQILWAGYGCSNHTSTNGKAGLTVPSAVANYYLTGSIYVVNESGVYRYQNRNPSTNTATRDHRLDALGAGGGARAPQAADVRETLRSAVGNLPQAPCYIILCLDSGFVGQPWAQLETGFVAGSMLVQASAIDLGCHFKTKLTAAEQKSIQTATGIPTSQVPQAIISIGPLGPASVSISVGLQGEGRPETGWVVPLTIRFFAAGADVLTGAAVYEFNLTTAKSPIGNAAICEVTGFAPGVYDVTARSEHTLMNVRRGVSVALTNPVLDMDTLLEGNANQDNTVDLADYAILSEHWLASKPTEVYDPAADFDRSGLVNTADLSLLAANWLRTSPVEIAA